MIKKIKTEYLLLILILVFGLFIRVYQLGSSPFWIDESISAQTAKQIIQTSVPRFESGLLDARAFVFHYIQAFFLLFGLNSFLVRFVSVVFGLLTLFLGYKIGKEYSHSGGLIVALFLSVFYLEVFFSRQARMYQMFQFFFFLSIYLLYKSSKNLNLLYFALISLFICYDTQLAGLILAPFFILHILIYNRKHWYLSLIPLALLVWKFFGVAGLTSDSASSSVNYATSYLGYTANMNYLLILFIPGLIWAFFKKKEFTSWLVIPSSIMLIGVFSLQVFAFRYAYFFSFILVLYSSLLLSFLYDRYGKIILIAIAILFLVPSNLFYPATYVNVIVPVGYNFNDASAPFTDYNALPKNLSFDLKSNTTLISLFSLDAEWYIRKPDYVIPFSMNGIGDDQISMNNSKGEVVDRYSGAKILNYSSIPTGPYYVLADAFSVSKLKAKQLTNFKLLTENCTSGYQAPDLEVYSCVK